VQDLALEIGEIDGIGIDQRDLADTRRSQIHRSRRPEPTRTDDDGVCIEKALLRFNADFVDEDVPGIAEKLIVVHRALKWATTGTLAAGNGRRRAVAKLLF